MSTLADYVAEVRNSVEDNGDLVTDNQTGDGTTTIFKLSSFPIKTNSELTPTGTLTVNGVVQTQGTNYTINYDNGECTFVTAPPNTQAIVWRYQKVYWRDERIISGVNAGIRDMKTKGAYFRGELYIKCRALTYDYDLTSTTDVPAASAFTDFTPPANYNPATARADIIKAQTQVKWGEYHPFGANQAFFPFYNFNRNERNFHIDGDPTPSDAIKLVYAAPLLPLVNLSDTSNVPDELYMAPVWYSMSTLLEKKEARRARYDQYTTMQNANANPPGTQAQTAADFSARYRELMDGAMPPMPMKQRRRRQGWQQLGTIR